jgi:anti-anti-sigma factor
MAAFSDPPVPGPLCAVHRVGDRLWFFGEIDESNADELAARTLVEIRAGAVGLDLSQVRFFAVAGIRILDAVQSAATFPNGGLLVVCSPEAMRTLRVCGLTGTNGLRFTEVPRPCLAARNERPFRREVGNRFH